MDATPFGHPLDGRDQTAMVDTRAATGYGEHITMEIAVGFVETGHTIAYLAAGVDRFYPAGHDSLLTRIVDAGAVVSELPCGAASTRWRYVDRTKRPRNRPGQR